jgi:ferredoxin
MKIIHYRENCIGCNACIEHCPNYFKINEEDGKADLLNSKKNKNIETREIEIQELENIKGAERDCPMRIIKVQGK